jgi:uncharacterized protein YceH (UPF0502 family)
MRPLSLVEIRVLGCLIEKERTVPDTYPMTLNGLRTACNQSSSRDPVMNLGDSEIVGAVEALKDDKLVRFVHASHGARTTKYRQVLDETLELDRAQTALLALLFLRGPQSAGELRTRSERLHEFESLRDIESVLASLGDRDEPLVACVGREAGQRDDRGSHLMGADELPARTPSVRAASFEPDPTLPERVAALEQKVADLERLLDDI